MPEINITVFGITEYVVEFITLIMAFLLTSILSWVFYRIAKDKRDRHKLMSTTQTSLVRDLKSGPAEVTGRVIAKDQTLSSPWSNRKCVHYRFHVEEDSHKGWLPIINDTSTSSFWVADETGEIEILFNHNVPGEHPEMDLQIDRNSKSGFGNDASSQLVNLLKSKYGKDTQGRIFNRKLRYTETFLEPGDKVYVFGQAFRTDDEKWVMRHGEMPLIVSQKGELDVQTREGKNIYLLAGISICLAIFTVYNVVRFVFSKI
jgi:hypothetical protein